MKCKKCKADLSPESKFCHICGAKQTNQSKPAKRRRANGMGTTYMLKGNRAKPWVARFQCGRDELNRRKWVTLGYYATKAEAEKALAINLIRPVSEKHRITLRELFEEWSASHFMRVGEQAKSLYSGSFALLSLLHDKVFSEIRTAQYQAVFDNCTKSYSYISTMKTLLGLLYAYAMENDICYKDYSKFIKISRKEKKEIEVFSDFEIKKLFKNDSVPGADMTLMLIYSGFRIQELLNLTVFDIDLERGLIIGGLKTDNGRNRTVPIHPKVKKYWQAYIDQAADHLFTVNGSPMTQRYFRDSLYYPMLKQLEIPRKTPHKCRDTFATLLARKGANTVAIQQLMGHSNYSFTANMYTAKNTDFLVENINKL